MAQIQLNPPAAFDFRAPEEWPRWKNRFEQYRQASGLTVSPELQQVSTLLYCLGEEADSVLASTDITEDDRKKYDKVIEKFDAFFKVRHNVIYERARFNRRNQMEGETAEQYILELYRLAENCSYGDLKDEMIRDRLVVGIRDGALSQQLQLDPDLTLDKAKTKVRQREAVGEQQQTLKETASNSSVNAIQPKKPRRNRPGQARRPTSAHGTNTRCTRCGKESHPRDKCPAKDATCHRCGKKGHFRSNCFTKNIGEVTKEEILDSAFLDTVEEGQNTAWMATVRLNKRLTRFKLDTGAEVTAISKDTYNEINKPKLMSPARTLFGPSHQPLNTLGCFQGTITHKDQVSKHTIYVVEGLKTNLLGLPAIRALGLAIRLGSIEDQSTDKDRIVQQYPSIFSGLGNLGEEYEICLKPDAKPFILYTPRHIPLPLRPQVKEELDRMESLNVISKVDKPTQWCAGMVVAPKQGGALRICVDLKPLNESVLREIHPLPKVDDVLAQLTGATVFSKLDANSGFWQIPLADNSRDLTTFITPFGRYRFNKLPFGISSAPEHFQKRMSSLLADLPGVLCLMDDVLVYGRTMKEHDERLQSVLERIKTARVTLNRDKCQFRKSQLKFLGHMIDKEGIRADPEKTMAITQMEHPTNLTELRRFMGMVNQLGKFSSQLAQLTQPLRQLLSKNSSWYWGPNQKKSFQDTKLELTKPTILLHYNPQAPTKVCADASSHGLGAVLLQEKEGQWRPVAYASRSLTETECRYAQIEKEALAATWACEKFSTYILGMRFTLETDHKPLISLLGTKNLDSLPPRILRFRLRLSRFTYDIVHVPGKSLCTADTLSRRPLSCGNDDCFTVEAEMLMELATLHLAASAKTTEDYHRAQETDEECVGVVQYTREGWPTEKRLVLPMFRPYWKVRGELSISRNGLLLYQKRIVVPKALRKRTLEKIHTGHQGIQRCRLRATTAVWWPGITNEVANMVLQCHICAQNHTPRRQQMIATELPDYPWQRVAIDLFYHGGDTYLAVVDYYSRYPEVQVLRNTNSTGVIKALKTIFSRFGIPEIVVSDNGPQYSSYKFLQFSQQYGFRHITSSPLYPQSNGQIERTIQTLKKLIRESKDGDLALLAYQTTPFPWCKHSPAELLMGRQLRSDLPQGKEQLTPKWPYLGEFRECNKSFKDQQKQTYDSGHRVKDRPLIKPQTDVWITSGANTTRGKVVTEADTPRSYIVDTPTGLVRRTSHHLNIVPEEAESQTPDTVPRDTTLRDIAPRDTTPRNTTLRSPIMTRSKSGAPINPPERLNYHPS